MPKSEIISSFSVAYNFIDNLAFDVVGTIGLTSYSGITDAVTALGMTESFHVAAHP